jgi:NADH dehydrogenase FAD-containing subunit
MAARGHADHRHRRKQRRVDGARDRPPNALHVHPPRGLLADIGRRIGVARILGVNFSGFAAWWLWRMIYLMKLPRIEKKVRVGLEWTSDLFFPKDIVQ